MDEHNIIMVLYARRTPDTTGNEGEIMSNFMLF